MKAERKILDKIGRKLKQVHDANTVCIVTFEILLVAWFVIAVYMKYAPFGNNSLLMNDAIHQYYPLFGQYRDRLLSGDGIFYSTGGGLGFNFYTIWTYYLSSPINLIILFFPASQIDFAMNLIIIIKVTLSGTAFAGYLRMKTGKNDYAIIPFACGYALSTFVLGYSYNIMWMDCLALFPVIMAGFEKMMQERKWKLYTVSLALCLWCNFYMSFIVCFFLVLCFLLYEHPSIKAFLKNGIRFMAASALGGIMSGVVLLPAYLGIVQTQSSSVRPDFEWMGRFSEIFAGKEGGIFAFSDPISINNEVSHNANLYCGVFVLGLAALFFMAKDISLIRKLKTAWLIILLILSLNNRALNYIWHGFHYQVGIPNRFAFLIIFLFLVISYQAFCRLSEYKNWQLLISGVISAAVYVTLYFLQRKNVTVRMLACTVLFTLVYMILELIYHTEMKKRHVWRKGILIFMCLEVYVSAVIGCKIQAGVSIDTFYRAKSDLQKVSNELPDEPYRTELSNPTVKNEGLAYNLSGSGIFSSMVNPKTAMLLHNIGFSTSSNAYTPAGAAPVINMLFGIKNYLIIKGDANRLDAAYTKEKTAGKVSVYKNEQVLPIAYLCKKEVDDWSEMNSDFFVNQMELMRLMTGKEYKVYTEQEYELTEANDIEISSLDEHQQFTYLSAKGNRNDHAVFEAEVREEEDLYLRIQAIHSNKTAVYVNGKLKACKDLNSSFYHVGKVDKGDTVRVEIGIRENSPTFGMISMSMYGYHESILSEAYRELSEGSMEVTDWKEGYAAGYVDVKGEKQTLFTTIPYDRGWTVYVDGKKQKVNTVQGGFLLVRLVKGKHRVVFSYEVPGLRAGAAVSLAGIIFFAGIIWIFAVWKRKRNRNITGDTKDESESKEQNLAP